MPSEVDHLLEEILELPTEQRRAIATRILDSIGESAEEVERTWRQEVKERLAELKAGRSQFVPWEQARERIFLT